MRWNLRKPTVRRALWASLVGLFLAMAAYQAFAARGLLALHRQLEDERGWQSRIEEMRKQNEALEKRIHQLRTDPETIKRIAREELKLADPEDNIILTPDKK